MHKDDESFEILESRVKKLEDKILGKVALSSNLKNNEDIISSLSEFSSKLGNALSTRDRMMMVMKRLEELERYMDPSYGESDLSDNIKVDLILGQEENLENQHELLNQISTLKKNLDSQPFADSAPVMNSELSKLYLQFSETEKKTEAQNREIARVIENYNSIVRTLTESYSNMDKIVTQAELSAQPRKNSD